MTTRSPSLSPPRPAGRAARLALLALPTWALTRQRSNPFHSYLVERLDVFVGNDDAQR